MLYIPIFTASNGPEFQYHENIQLFVYINGQKYAKIIISFSNQRH